MFYRNVVFLFKSTYQNTKRFVFVWRFVSLPNKTSQNIQAKRPRRVLEPVGVLHANLSQASTCTSVGFGGRFLCWKVSGEFVKGLV